ncbi:MAG: type II toxin-antitoxin system VapC family toxin [Pseudonocardia sp.]
MAEDPTVLRSDVIELLQADSTTLVRSAVVPWEAAIKWRSGKLTLPEHPRDWTARLVREFGTEALPVTHAHVVQVADLPDHHGDPFDRLLIAQAQVDGIPIVTGNGSFTRYDVEVIAAR